MFVERGAWSAWYTAGIYIYVYMYISSPRDKNLLQVKSLNSKPVFICGIHVHPAVWRWKVESRCSMLGVSVSDLRPAVKDDPTGLSASPG
jgi:hypothetical protein